MSSVAVSPQPQTYTSPAWPYFDQEQVDAVARVLASGKINYWTGPEGRAFEKEFAEFFGAKRSIALGNGSLAIELAIKALDLQPGDDVIVTPRTFIASASCAIIWGMNPVFADVDRDSGNITAESIERVLTPKTKAIIPVHLGGWPCDMGPIMNLARSKGIKVIEDCAQSHLATYNGKYLGTFGDMNAWSFCQDKIMTTGGEGGMVTTDSEELWSKAWSFKDHGKSYEAKFHRQHPPGFRWEHESFGTNWRLTEMQSVLGRIQLHRLKDWVAKRRANAQVLIDRLSNIPGLRVPVPASNMEHAYYRFYCYLEPGVLKGSTNRDAVVDAVREQGLPLFSGSCSEIYLEKAFDGKPYKPAHRLPVAKELGETSVAFLVHPTLEASDLHRVADAFIEAFNAAKR